ncbi:MAG: DUF3302 domain-containing protein [Gammaproteobacteria bacterium]|jgi:uncharacterized BrkB/YihY/UPF0761 family membrane protein|nr:DUF3302 domain-containing protein [Gammaproteobacteria bacterium]
MTGLDIFALVILFVLAAVVVGVILALGMLPGKIAHSRNHPQAEAINMCGWWGVITMGLLLPLAFIWAYTKPATSGPETTKLEQSSEEEK